MTPLQTIGVEFAIGALLVCAIAFIGKAVKARHYWKADHLYEIAAEVGYMTVVGMILSWFFSFHGTDALSSMLSCLLFSTFLVPFLGLKWVSEWPGSRFEVANDNPVPGFVCFSLAMCVLGGGAYFACLNSANAAYAIYVGLGIAGGAFALLLLAAATCEGWMFGRA